jgi:hypothetical protein
MINPETAYRSEREATKTYVSRQLARFHDEWGPERVEACIDGALDAITQHLRSTSGKSAAYDMLQRAADEAAKPLLVQDKPIFKAEGPK